MKTKKHNTGGTIGDAPYNSTVTQMDYRSKGRRSENTSTPRGTEESGKSILSRGSKGSEVLQLQEFLKSNGYYKGEVDGIFGPKTEAAVRQFQTKFNSQDTSDNRISYVQNGQVRELSKGKEALRVDGIVGDATRSALMYRKMPKPAARPQREEAKSPEPSLSRGYSTTDDRVMGSPDVMDYAGGLAMMGLAALPGVGASLAESAAANASSSAMRNLVGGSPKIPTAPRVPLNPNVPTAPSSNLPRTFQPRTPSSYGTRIGYNTGGDIGNVISSVAPLLSLIPGAQPFAIGAAGIGQLMSTISTMENKRKPTGGSPGAYNMGGDISLNGQSTQVKGNPNVYDSEEYETPQGKIKLDHNEVIKGTFAYSNRLRNPATGNTFAEDIAPIEKSTGKASKRGRINDPFSNNTIKINEQRAATIAKTQEVLATLLGKRTPQGMDPKNAGAVGYQTGGPITPRPGQTYMKVGDGYYYDPYDQRFLKRDPKTGTYAIDNNEAKFSAYDKSRPMVSIDGDNLTTYNSTLTRKYTNSISGHRNKYPTYQQASPADWEQIQAGQEGVTPGGTLPEVTISGKRNAPAPRGARRASSPVAALDSLTRAEEFTANPALQYSQTAQQEMGQTAQQVAAAQTLPAGVTPASAVDSRTYGSAPVAPTNKYGTTVGDVFQAIEVGSKFGQLVGGPEKETPHLDRSQISKQAYDPRPVLQRNQANFQAQSNSLQTSSPNLRRALQNSLYAKKLEADSGVMSKYQEMNNQATTKYEDRISNRARYNNQVMTLTDDMNARNRGQFMNASQNAMTSLGNFGEALNRKKQNYDALNILRTIYPDVYGRIGSII